MLLTLYQYEAIFALADTKSPWLVYASLIKTFS